MRMHAGILRFGLAQQIAAFHLIGASSALAVLRHGHGNGIHVVVGAPVELPLHSWAHQNALAAREKTNA